MKATLTLDAAQDEFRDKPTRKTAAVYLAIVTEYWEDEMIGDATLDAAHREIMDWAIPRSVTIPDPRMPGDFC